MTSKEGREAAIQKVSQCILQDRNTSYGDPEDNFQNIADLWLASGFQCDVHDVSILMIQVKMARIKSNPGHLDSWIDIAGYALCQAGMIIRAEAKEPAQYDSSKATAPSSGLKESVRLSTSLTAQSEQNLSRLGQLVQALESVAGTGNTQKIS